MKQEKEKLIIKRGCIENSVLEEINEKYPKVTSKGVAYDLGLTYITMQIDYFSDPTIRKLVKDYGAQIIAVVCFFRMKMCQPFGWCCRVDKDSLDTLVEDCAFQLKMDEDEVRECYQALVDRKAFYVISDETGTYLTDTQQLFNFEILNNNRLRERQRKQASRAKEKEERKKAEKSKPPTDETPAPAIVKEEPAEQSPQEDDPFSMGEDNNDPLFW